MKKLITWLLIAAMATSALASCSGGDDASGTNETNATTTAPVETEAEDTRIYPDHLPDVTFDNYDFKIAHWMIDGWTLLQDIDSEGEDGDLINDAVYKRNSKIEEKYAVNIVGTYVAHDQLNTVYRQMATAGDTSYDIAYVRSHEAPDLALNGFFLDLYQLENIDWEMPWWDQQSIAELSLGGKLFMAESDITLTDKGATGCMYFNTQLQKDYGVEDMYQLVLDEKWTWNKMLDIAKGVREDLDGNSTMDDQDLWGVGMGDDITYMFLHAGNARYATKDEDDYPVISFNTEKNLEIAQRVLDIMYDDSVFFYGGNRTMFEENRLLFLPEMIKNSSQMREIEDYGIIPQPKYDESQETYKATVSIHHSSVLTIPKTIPEESYSRTGVILEALSAESKYTLINTYYDTVLRVKNVRDEKSVEMLDIIFNNRVYDLGEFYQFGDFNTEFLRANGRGHKDVVSLFAKNEKKIQKEIDSLIKIVEDYE
ncbi:MAG: carbohydrate ABC transporter substrate-binding protein [Clostridia bacterium]|nr:carbohydrate ABC transporter substrate-binding protein [Clostridia bacterium]